MVTTRMLLWLDQNEETFHDWLTVRLSAMGRWSRTQQSSSSSEENDAAWHQVLSNVTFGHLLSTRYGSEGLPSANHSAHFLFADHEQMVASVVGVTNQAIALTLRPWASLFISTGLIFCGYASFVCFWFCYAFLTGLRCVPSLPYLPVAFFFLLTP